MRHLTWKTVALGFVLVIGGSFTLLMLPMICADPGGCGWHPELWAPWGYLVIGGGFAAIIAGFGLFLAYATLASRPT